MACAVQNMHIMVTALPGGVCGYWSRCGGDQRGDATKDAWEGSLFCMPPCLITSPTHPPNRACSWYESVRDAPEMRTLLGLGEGDR